MRAALAFAEHLAERGRLPEVRRIRCSLFGSLGSTGLGHGTPDAILAGLATALLWIPAGVRYRVEAADEVLAFLRDQAERVSAAAR